MLNENRNLGLSFNLRNYTELTNIAANDHENITFKIFNHFHCATSALFVQGGQGGALANS